MDAAPHEESPEIAIGNTAKEKRPPTPTEFIEAFRVFLKGYWQAPRHKGKWTETAMLLLTVFIAGAAIYSAWIFRRQLDDARHPWVGVEDDTTFDEGNIPWVGQHGYDAVQKMAAEDRLPVRVLYHLRNSGNGPALNTQLVIQPLMFPQSGSDESQIHAMIEKSCQIAEQRIAQGNGDLLLPGGKHTVPYQFGEWDSTKFVVTPGCIVYRDINGGFHHTRICYAAAMFVSPKPKALESCQDESAD